MRRRGKTVTLGYILSRQPKSLRKDPRYSVMMEYWGSAPSLGALRLGSRGRRLLEKALVSPENLPRFYRTYNLPAHPFFPLFFAIKREYLTQRDARKRTREDTLSRRMLALPPEIRKTIRFCAEVEKRYHPRGDYPVWTKTLWPGSIKRMKEYENAELLDWQNYFGHFFSSMALRYRGFTTVISDRLLACMLLGCLPDAKTLTLPPAAEIRKRFRILSKTHHPDTGGENRMFVLLKAAEELLLSG